MGRLVTRFSDPASLVSALATISLLAGCASNPTGNAPASSGSNSSSGSTGGSGSSSGGSSGSGTTSGQGGSAGSSGSGGSSGADNVIFVPQAGVGPVTCAPTNGSGGNDSLPFTVDAVYKPTGWMGDAPAYVATPGDADAGIAPSNMRSQRMQLLPTGYGMGGDACSVDVGSRSSTNAKGTCWKVVYTPFPINCAPNGGGWAGAFWQYPNNNFGQGDPANNPSGSTAPTQAGGYLVPSNPDGGYSVLTFWARGASGGEKVKFFSGEGTVYPCADYTSGASTNPPTVTLTNAWKQYTIDLTGLAYSSGAGVYQAGNYFGGIIGAFGFAVGDQTVGGGGSAPDSGTGCPVPEPGRAGPDAGGDFFYSTVTFYVDDIEIVPAP